MSYGIEQWGTGRWSGADFIVTDHVPSDSAFSIDRLPLISFTLLSQNGNITLASINLTVNGSSLITNGIFTDLAAGTIDSTNPTAVKIAAQTLHAFAPLEIITVIVSALNASNQAPTLGSTWQFMVDDTIHMFQNYIIRKFERVFRAQASQLTQPQNPHAQINLTPPPNLSGVVL